MSRKSWIQVKEVFHEALRHDTSEREKYLEKACADDISFRIEVESLLISLAEAESFLEQPVVGEISKPATWRLQNGQQISHYTIVEPIGIGGMGEVYLAEDQKLRRQVALKILPEQMLADRDRLRRFQREADVVSALNHPNILTIYEFGIDGEIHLFACEFVKGETLREKLSRGRVSISETLDIAVQIASALNAAHEAGVVHRDIKPENVMIRDDGYVKVLDFGLAKQTESKPSDQYTDTRMLVVSQPGLIMGTVAYMSPEQVRARSIDARTDLFSLGVVLYEMLSGRSPFTGETTTDVIAATLQAVPAPLGLSNEFVPAELDRIIAKLLEKDRNERYQTAIDLLIDLKRVQKQVEFLGDDERVTSDQNLTGNTTKILSAQPTANNASSGVNWRRRYPTAVLLIAATLAVSAAYWYFASGPKKQIESIAVMPFVNQSGNADMEYLSDGMTDTLISKLSQLSTLKVKARTSVFRYKGKDTDPKTLAGDLNVQAILNGHISQQGSNLRLNLELVDGQTENIIWSEQYDRKQADVVALQSEIARDVLQKLNARLSGAEIQKLANNNTENAEAYQLYLKGRYEWNKRTKDGFNQAITLFQEALSNDPEYAMALVGLADTYSSMGAYSLAPTKDTTPKAKAYIMRALEIDDKLAEPHASLASLRLNQYWDFKGAEDEYKKAIELNPSYAIAHQGYAELLNMLEQYDEALVEIRRAEELDPLSSTISTEEGVILHRARRYNEAMAQYRKIIALDSQYWRAHGELAFTLAELGRYDEAIAELKMVQSLFDHSNVTAAMGYVYAKAGRTSDARNILMDLDARATKEYVSPYWVAMVRSALGEKNKAFDQLMKAYNERSEWVLLLKGDQRMDNLHNDPRFNDLLRQIGF